MSNEPAQFIGLPKEVVTPTDVSRLEREIANLDEILNQGQLRKSPVELKAKDISPNLHEFLVLNKKDILKAEDRQQCATYLETVEKKAPRLHFSFADVPNQEVTDSLMEWLRKEIHPLALVVIGLAPGIGAGCYLRTTNKLFDFTLKTRLLSSRQNLVNMIKNASLESANTK